MQRILQNLQETQGKVGPAPSEMMLRPFPESLPCTSIRASARSRSRAASSSSLPGKLSSPPCAAVRRSTPTLPRVGESFLPVTSSISSATSSRKARPAGQGAETQRHNELNTRQGRKERTKARDPSEHGTNLSTAQRRDVARTGGNGQRVGCQDLCLSRLRGTDEGAFQPGETMRFLQRDGIAGMLQDKQTRAARLAEAAWPLPAEGCCSAPRSRPKRAASFRILRSFS